MKKYSWGIIKTDESILRSIGRFTVDNFGGRSIKIEYMDGGYNLTDNTDEAYRLLCIRSEDVKLIEIKAASHEKKFSMKFNMNRGIFKPAVCIEASGERGFMINVFSKFYDEILGEMRLIYKCKPLSKWFELGLIIITPSVLAVASRLLYPDVDTAPMYGYFLLMFFVLLHQFFLLLFSGFRRVQLWTDEIEAKTYRKRNMVIQILAGALIVILVGALLVYVINSSLLH